MSEKYSFLSLFCGCGGFDLGLMQAGYKCIFAYDNDQIAVDTYNYNLN